MITTRTVFILGAGASADYHFPSGADLKRQVIAVLTNPTDANSRVLHELSDDGPKINEMLKALRFSAGESVDAFLEHRPDFVDPGKIAISLVLCPRENLDTLFESTKETRWLEYLFRKMKVPFDEFANNQLSVITYNYDRSFETFLFRVLCAEYGKSESEVATALNKISIVHLHGQLGTLPWQNLPDSREYSPSVALDDIRIASQSIKVIHGSFDISTDPGFRSAHTLLRQAKRIVFLGFGYAPTNIVRIMDAFPLNASIMGSNYGLTEMESGQIKDHLFAGKITLGRTTWKVLDFLREAFSLYLN